MILCVLCDVCNNIEIYYRVFKKLCIWFTVCILMYTFLWVPRSSGIGQKRSPGVCRGAAGSQAVFGICHQGPCGVQAVDTIKKLRNSSFITHTIWLLNSLPWNHHFVFIGEPSISIRAIYTMAMLNNQNVSCSYIIYHMIELDISIYTYICIHCITLRYII